MPRFVGLLGRSGKINQARFVATHATVSHRVPLGVNFPLGKVYSMGISRDQLMNLAIRVGISIMGYTVANEVITLRFDVPKLTSKREVDTVAKSLDFWKNIRIPTMEKPSIKIISVTNIQ